MPAFPIPPKPDRLPMDDGDLWDFLIARLEFQNHEVVALESMVRRTGRRMRNRAGGYSTAPESRALVKAQGEQGVIARKLEKLMDRVPAAPEPELTEAQFRAELEAVMQLHPDRPEAVVDEVIALTRLAAGEPPDADAAARLADLLAQYPADAYWASFDLPDIEA